MNKTFIHIIFILLLIALPLKAQSQNQTVQLSGKTMTLKNAFEQIEKQTGLSIDFDSNILNVQRNIPTPSQATSLENLMSQLLKDTNCIFTINKSHIVISASNEKTTESQAQKSSETKTYTGTVIDENGESIIGASVVVKGEKIAATTNVDGKFVIDAPEKSTVLISYVGYETQEIYLKEKTNIAVKLTENIKSLNEVVVVGYGTQKKSDITGSVTSLKAGELTSAPSVSAAQALQGRAAGVMVQNASGSPSGDVTIRIRGANSLTFGNDPLIIIDGVQGGNIGNLNPNDIESTEILKDAAALSIYGSRGANGVILITTKSGKKGTPSISYNAYVGVDKVRRVLPSLNATDYANLVNQYKSSNGLSPIFTDDAIAKLGNGINWQNSIFRNGFTQNHNVSISGTKQDISYFVSGGYVNKEGIILNTNYNQYTLRANLKVQATKRISFGVNSFVSYDISHNGDYNSAIISALQWAPSKSVYDSNGKYTQPGGGVGPVSLYNPAGYAKEIVNDQYNSAFTIAPNAEFKITDYLKLSSILAYKLNSTLSGYFDNQVVNNGPAENITGSTTNGRYMSLQNSNVITFDKSFGNHSIKITGVYEILKDRYNRVFISALGIPVGLGYNGIQFGSNPQKPYTELTNTASQSFMGRLNYSYKNKYLFSFSDRYDGASQLAPGHKYENFGAVSVGWNVMEESFMSKIKPVLTEFKLRGSYGSVGNASVPAYSSQLKFYSGLDANNNPTLAISQLNNPNLRWERTTELNVGTDVQLWKGRITLSAEYYSKITTDLLMWQTVPIALGVQSVLNNVGSVSNRGIELAIGGIPVSGNVFNWNTNVTFNYNKNRILALDGASDRIIYSSDADYPGLVGSYVQMVGQPMGTFLGYKYAGVWNQSEVSTAALYGAKPGDAKYVDIDKNGKIDKQDIGVIGNAQPVYTFGWNNTFIYRNLELNVFVQGVAGNQVYNQNRIRREAFTADAFPTNPIVKNHYTNENQKTIVPAFNGFEYLNSSRWVEDGSYLRFKNISLAYKLPKSLLTKSNFISAAKIYASVSNLLTITKYTGFDPEASIGKDATAAGVDRSVYPSSKGVVFGINVTF